jgi:hypothetical protein
MAQEQNDQVKRHTVNQISETPEYGSALREPVNLLHKVLVNVILKDNNIFKNFDSGVRLG